MQLTMMSAAKWYRELIADLAAERPLLREPQMMGIGRCSAADHTRLTHDRSDVLPITNTSRFGQGKYAFVDPIWAGLRARGYFG